MISKGLKFFRFSGLQGRIGLGVFLIAVIQAIAALWLVSYNSGIRASSDDVRLTYQPLTETLEQLHHDVGSFASGLRTDILRRGTANAPYRKDRKSTRLNSS